MTALARQLVEHPRWRWEPGMLVWDPDSAGRQTRAYERLEDGIPGARCVAWRPDGSRGCLFRVVHAADHGGAVPDLTDPATAGVLLGWLPGAVTVMASHQNSTSGLVWCVSDGWHKGEGSTLGEAVARALLAVPQHTPRHNR